MSLPFQQLFQFSLMQLKVQSWVRCGVENKCAGSFREAKCCAVPECEHELGDLRLQPIGRTVNMTVHHAATTSGLMKSRKM